MFFFTVNWLSVSIQSMFCSPLVPIYAHYGMVEYHPRVLWITLGSERFTLKKKRITLGWASSTWPSLCSPLSNTVDAHSNVAEGLPGVRYRDNTSPYGISRHFYVPVCFIRFVPEARGSFCHWKDTLPRKVCSFCRWTYWLSKFLVPIFSRYIIAVTPPELH